MRRKPLESLGEMVRDQRGKSTLREAAREIGLSPATLLRVESGRIPDVGTFGLLCRWLQVDPSVFLGAPPRSRADAAAPGDGALLQVSAHLRADRLPSPETASALAQMLLLAARQQPPARTPSSDESA